MTPAERFAHPLAILADQIAEKAHAGQTRRWSTAPYITHPRRVARLVARLDSTTEVDVAAALLHDLRTTGTDLTERLLAGGAEPDAATQVVNLVEELMPPFLPKPVPREERQRLAEAKLRRISDRAKRITLCDRLDNLIGGEPMPADALARDMAECRVVVDIAGIADPILAGWLLTEIDRRAASIQHEED